MAEICRTCKHTDPGCLIRIRGEQRADCWYHEPRETPLLVDELANVLNDVTGRLDAEYQYSGKCRLSSELESIKAAKIVLGRYQEEVGDA